MRWPTPAETISREPRIPLGHGKRRLRCSKCGREKRVDAGIRPCTHCDIWMDAICACPCDARLGGMREDAIYHSEACEKRLKRNASTDREPTRHPSRNGKGTHVYLTPAEVRFLRSVTHKDTLPVGNGRSLRNKLARAQGRIEGREAA